MNIARYLLLLAVPAASAADLKPCDLLPESDVRAVLGAEWKLWKQLSKGEMCGYQGSNPGQAATLLLTPAPSGAAETLAGRRKMAGDKVKASDGPGSGAYRVSTKFGHAHVFGKGKWVAQVEVTPTVAADPWPILDRLAKPAYGRLP